MKTAVRKDFPNDDDGEVLYRLALKGTDLTKKRKIEFYCYAQDQNVAKQILTDLDSYGYESSIFVDDGEGGTGFVSVYSSITMLPKYELVVLEQRRLNLILEAYNTRCDGWITESQSEGGRATGATYGIQRRSPFRSTPGRQQ